MESEKKSLRYQINMKIEENNYLRQTNINMINNARRDAVVAAEEKFKEQEHQTLRKFEIEKQGLVDELMSLKSYSKDHNYFKNQMTLRLALVKFRFTVQMMKIIEGNKSKPIKEITDDLRKIVMGRQLEDHEERLKELEQLKDQHQELILKNTNNIFKLHELTEKISIFEKSMQEFQDENWTINSQLARERQEIRTLKLENQSLSNSDKINKEIIGILENDKAELIDKVEKLSIKLESKDPDFKGSHNTEISSKLFMKKTLQQMNIDKFESLKQIINENVREISTITDLRGIENEIVFNEYDSDEYEIPELPKLHIAIQTDFEPQSQRHHESSHFDIAAHNKIKALEEEIIKLKKVKNIRKSSYDDQTVTESEEYSETDSKEEFTERKSVKQDIKK